MLLHATSHQVLRALLRPLSSNGYRPFSIIALRMAEGDTGSMRPGGIARSDTWNRREKAAEDMYILEREKALMVLLKEKIAKQEAALARDRAILSTMEDQYGHATAEQAT